MERGQAVWLRSTASQWGWVPAVVLNREEVSIKGVTLLKVTLRDDTRKMTGSAVSQNHDVSVPFDNATLHRNNGICGDSYYEEIDPFEITINIDMESLARDELDDIKIREYESHDQAVGGVDDLIGLAHLHEPAILHSLRLRYDKDIIYTSTGPILIAINPFKSMPLYTDDIMRQYRLQGEGGVVVASRSKSDNRKSHAPLMQKRLPPHVYLIADDAYRAMIRGIDIHATSGGISLRKKTATHRRVGEIKGSHDDNEASINQSILVSGESGAGKTVTTKIVLKYFAMLSKLVTDSSNETNEKNISSVEQQVLDSNPILESFGNSRTIRNDNSSRFGKFINVRFSPAGRLIGASIDTYLLEKVRLIRQTQGERNFHVFYQFLEAASDQERDDYFLANMHVEDFVLLNKSETYDRRDKVSDVDMHKEMLEAMGTLGFDRQYVKSIMRVIVAILYAGNMTFTEKASLKGDTCTLDNTEAAEAAACLLGVSFDELAAALTSRALFLKEEMIIKELNAKQAQKALEALLKSIYGANFDLIVETINGSIHNERVDKKNDKSAYIGVLDIFGFETFEVNSFEQLCINYTNETLQQHFNKHIFKMEQQEYEREGILWNFISFPDNQDVLDLIDMKRIGILAVLDEQCIVEWGSDEKFILALYKRCEKHDRFHVSPQQRALSKFSVEHYAGLVEYSTYEWIEKNKDQLPASSVQLLQSSNFSIFEKLQGFVRPEGTKSRGSIAMKSVAAKFSEQLKDLCTRIDGTTPHYIRCMKPNDELLPNDFDPKNIVEQLRYSGVLEAIRVSRAGYPTRYPHALFLSRYYMLGNLCDGNKRNKDIVELVKLVVFHIWEYVIEKQKVMAVLEATNSKFRTITPLKKKNKMNSQTILDIPQTKEIFDKLDFGTQCAVAGLQLGRTKVFLRREAFDRIEALRAVIFGKSATIIQARFRGRRLVTQYFRLKAATVKLQAAIRYFLANLEFIRERKKVAREKSASTMIQMAYRQYRFRTLGVEKRGEIVNAATMIQAFARGSFIRSHLEDLLPKGVIEDNHVEETKNEGIKSTYIQVIPSAPNLLDLTLILSRKNELFEHLAKQKWDSAIALMTECPKLAEQDEDETGRLPLHIVAGHNLHAVLEKVYALFPSATDTFDKLGRLPIHVAAENDALVPVKYLLSKRPDLADTMMLRPVGRLGGGIPLHIACKINASSSVITAMLSSNFNTAKKSDANGDLPIHLLLRNGEEVSGTVVQVLLDTYPTAATRADMFGDLPLSVALKHKCKPEVVKIILMHNPDAAKVRNGRDGHSPIFLAFQNHASDKTILGLMNHSPELVVAVDKRTGMLPIEMATKQNHSKNIVYDLLRHDMPIDLKEKTSVKHLPHKFSWNHLVSEAKDVYHDVVSRVLLQCTEPQILALSQVKDKHGSIALTTATPLCKHEFRVMFRLFRTLEVADPTPVYTNGNSGTQIFYALRYAPPPEKPGYFVSLYRDDKSKYNFIEPWDNSPVETDDLDIIQDMTKMNYEEKLEYIKNERSIRVVAKLTSRTDIVMAEISKREDFQLSRHYVPAIISVDHTILHAAYSEAMVEPSYCITMKAADITAENLLLDLRRHGGAFSKESLKSIAMSLLHVHNRGLIHGDFGSHNVAKFSNRWKILGIGGSTEIGQHTNPKRGFYHPPEAVVLETRDLSLGEKNVGAAVVAIISAPTYDIWGYGTILYEALAGIPLSPYRSACKAKRAMTTAELFKVGQWDDRSLRKALRHVEGDSDAQDLIRKLLHPNPNERVRSMYEALEHPFFGLGKLAVNSNFVKPPSIITTDSVVLKIYSDEYMTKKGITETDIVSLQPKEKNTFIIECVPNEVSSEIAVISSEDPASEVEDTPNSEVTMSETQQKCFAEIDSDTSTLPLQSEVIPSVSSLSEELIVSESSVTKVRHSVTFSEQPVSYIPPLLASSQPQSQLPASKSKLKLNMKVLKSKFGKKSVS